MSGYYGQQQHTPPQPPPLPPRNPRPAEHGSYDPAYYGQYGTLPLPPPIPARKPVPAPGPARASVAGRGPPPIPPRPSGYGSPAAGPNAYPGQAYTQVQHPTPVPHWQPAPSNPYAPQPAQSFPGPQSTAPGHEQRHSSSPSATISGPDTTLYSLGNTLESLNISDTQPPPSPTQPYHQHTSPAYHPPAPLQEPLAPAPSSLSNPQYPSSPSPYPSSDHQYPAPRPSVTAQERYTQEPTPSNQAPHHMGYASAEPAYTSPPPPPSVHATTYVTACIDAPMDFPATWYTHPSAPDFFICSWCYSNLIHPTRFRNDFEGKFLDDGKKRQCLFKRPQMKDALFKQALSTGHLQSALDWMRRRPSVPECKGVGGCNGKEGIKWYATKGKAIPGFVACEACYEDVCLSNPFASNLEPAPNAQGEYDIWVCDLALPYNRSTYIETGKTNNWAGFVSETKGRAAIPVCPKATQAFGPLRSWFRPKNRNPEGLLICGACYCDYVAYGPDPGAWEKAAELNQRYATTPICHFGHFNFLTAMLRAIEVKDSSLFWRAIREGFREPLCDSKGMPNATWYTLPSHSSSLDVCGQCYATVLKTLNIGHLFVPRANLARDQGRVCLLNPSNGRFATMLSKVLEAFYLQDTSRLERWAVDYAGTPVCGRDADFNDRQWYGWAECTICPDCYVEFVRGTALADRMPLQSTLLKESHLCEMYSPRMRNLYLQACETGDPAQLLQYSMMRRHVYFETMPACRMMVAQAQMEQQKLGTLNMMSMTYNHMGTLQDAVSNRRHTRTYGDSSVGYGFGNHDSYQGAIYGKEAADLYSSSRTSSNTVLVGALEKRWREVE